MKPPRAHALDLQPHPEGGWYRQTWKSAERVRTADGRDRATATLILFLLPAGEASAWHRVASEEIWLGHEGVGHARARRKRAGAGPRCGRDGRRRSPRRASASGRRAGGRLAADAAFGCGCARQLRRLPRFRLRPTSSSRRTRPEPRGPARVSPGSGCRRAGTRSSARRADRRRARRTRCGCGLRGPR